MSQENSSQGLSSQEAAQRLKVYGFNALPGGRSRTILSIIFDIVREPMFLLLIAAATVYLVLGELQEGLALTVFVVLIIVITLYQQGKTENALKKLRDLTSPRALVLRDGESIRISGSEVVPDDIVLINEGDRIPADGILISANDLQIDESLLTGESLPVFKKSTEDTHLSVSQENNTVCVYSGTMVVQGQGILLVRATGKNTTIGRIGTSLQLLESEPSPLQNQVHKLVSIFAALGIIISVLLVLVLGLIEGDWLKASLSGIALAMSLLPEEFPVILTIFPALGAWRLSKRNVLTRKISAIETLGSISVLCVDKTGTITENAMRVTEVWVNGNTYNIDYSLSETMPKEIHNLIEFSILASEILPFDPMEKAFHSLGKQFLTETEHLHPDWHLVQEYDLSPQLRSKTHVWQSGAGQKCVVAAKGAPEAILELCHIEGEERKHINMALHSMANKGLRVLAVAQANFEGESWPTTQHGFNFTFLGVIGLADPVRKGILAAVNQCYEAGIRIIMITGDYLATAKSIGQQAHISSDGILTGSELDSMSDLELQVRLRTSSICARITPEQKLRIVQAIKEQGSIVGMTGDGVNDAPALKSAHVGIAMGSRGTDVAREASSLVLTDDNFTSIVSAIQLGRSTFDNIKKSMTYILAIHIPIAGLALLPVLLGWPAFFYPMHIAFLQLMIDPVCSISFENEPPEPDLMKRQPRDPKAPLISKKRLLFSIMQGMGVLLIALITYHFALHQMPEPQARAFTFVTLIVANIVLIFSNRSDKTSLFNLHLLDNKVLVWITIFTLASLSLTIYLPFLAGLFKFEVLPAGYLLLSFGIGLGNVLWFEVVKWIRNIGPIDKR